MVGKVAADAVTHINDALLAQSKCRRWNHFTFKGAGGDEVEGFIIKPPGFDASKKYPLKFLIHGGPQGAWGNSWTYRWNAELFAATGNYVVVMINFHGSTGYGQKFTDAISGDWGGKPFEDLMKGLDYVEKTYPFIDKTREAALGASYGGYMANWLLGHTDRFKCIVSHDGIFNTESAYGKTEELWFNEWEFKGAPWKNRELYRKFSPHFARINSKRRRWSCTASSITGSTSRRHAIVHHAAASEGPVEVSLLPRRRSLGPEAAEFRSLVSNRQRLGRPMV